MTNKNLYEQIASNDVLKLSELIQKGWEETSDFENCILQLATSLDFLYQAIKWGKHKHGN